MISRSKWSPFRRRVGLVPFLVVAGWNSNAPSFAAAFQSRLSSGSPIDPSLKIDRHSFRPNCSNHRRSKTVSCELFFRATEGNPAPRRKSLKPGILEDLQSSNITLPFEVLFEEDDDSDRKGTLIIRLMTPQDSKEIIPMCISEFGSGPTASLLDFPWQDMRKISDWWDRVYFEPSIALALRAKMNANLASKHNAGLEDPAVLVLCRVRPEDQIEKVVAMVELSLQAPEADRNPPTLPVPLQIKKLYCQVTGQRLQGWVTNLLVDPKYRGLGYSKMLMAATEGVARSWGRDYIYLHADADFKTGKVSQGLYNGLGYQVVQDDKTQMGWMGNDFNPFSGIRMIEGVPLLCFSKRL
jgi:GNAT superfamily N-acetyltransferase